MRPGIPEVVFVAPIAQPSADTHSHHMLGLGGEFCESLERRTMSVNLMSEEALTGRLEADRLRIEDHLQRDTSCTARLRGNCDKSAWTSIGGSVHPGPRPD